MLANDDINLLASLFLKDRGKKVLLLYGHSVATLSEKLISYVKNTNVPSYYFDLAQSSNIENILANIPNDQSSIFILNVDNLENPFLRYQLDRWQCKVIILCDQSLLHPTLDPTIYFSPFKGDKVQRHLFSKVEYRSFPVRTTKNHSEPKQLRAAVPERKPELSRKLRDHFLNRKLMTNDPVMMQMLADRVMTDDGYKKFLFKLVYASRDDEEMKIAAANAMTILNYARVSLSCLDLSRIKIPYADLSASICHCTLFIGANLDNVNFNNAFLGQANLSASSMEGVSFGKFPYVSFEHNITATTMTPDKKTLAVGDDGGYIRLYNAENMQEKLVLKRETMISFSKPGIKEISISADEKYLVALTQDSYMYVWDVLARKIIRYFYHNSYVLLCGGWSHFCISPNGRYFAFYIIKLALLEVWDLNRGIKLPVSTNAWHHEYDNTWAKAKIQFSSKNDSLFILTKSKIYQWRIKDDKTVYVQDIGSSRATGFEFSPNNKWLIIIYEDRIVLLDTDTFDVQGRVNCEKVKYVRFDAKCEHVFAFSETTVYRWNIDTNHGESFHLDPRRIKFVEISRSNVFIYVKEGSEDCLHLLQASDEVRQQSSILTSQLRPRKIQEDYMSNMQLISAAQNIPWQEIRNAITNNKGSVLVISKDNFIYLYEIKSSILIRTFMFRKESSLELNNQELSFSYSGNYLICHAFNKSRSGICIFNLKTGEEIYCNDKTHNNLLAISEFHDAICFVDDKNFIVLVEFGIDLSMTVIGKHSTYTFFGSFLSQHEFVSCDESGVIKIWDLRSRTCVKELSLPCRYKEKGSQSIVCTCYTVSNDKKWLMVGYEESVSKLKMQTNVAVINCRERKLVLCKDLYEAYSLTSIYQIVFHEKHKVIFALVSGALGVFTSDQWQLVQLFDIFSIAPHIETSTDDKLVVKMSDEGYFEFSLNPDRDIYAVLARTSAKTNLYLQGAIIDDVINLSSSNRSLIMQSGGKDNNFVPPESPSNNAIQETPEKCQMM